MTIFDEISQQGFVVIGNVLSKEKTSATATYLRETYLEEHFSAIKSGVLPSEFQENNPFPECSKKSVLRFMGERGRLEAATLQGSLSVKARLSEICKNILREPGLLEIFSKMLDSPNVYMHMCPAVRIIHPNFSFAHVPPHNDISYNFHYQLRNSDEQSFKRLFLTVWVPLRATWGVDGGVAMYPNQRTLKIAEAEDEFWVPDMSVDPSNSLCPRYEVGDVIVFEPDLIHGSAPISDEATDFRISMDCRIFGEKTLTQKHYMDLRTGEVYDPGTGPCGR